MLYSSTAVAVHEMIAITTEKAKDLVAELGRKPMFAPKPPNESSLYKDCPVDGTNSREMRLLFLRPAGSVGVCIAKWKFSPWTILGSLCILRSLIRGASRSAGRDLSDLCEVYTRRLAPYSGATAYPRNKPSSSMEKGFRSRGTWRRPSTIYAKKKCRCTSGLVPYVSIRITAMGKRNKLV